MCCLILLHNAEETNPHCTMHTSPGLPHTKWCNHWFRGQSRAHLHQKLLIRLKSLDTGWISHIQPFEEGVLPVIPQLSHDAATESKDLDDILQRMINYNYYMGIVFKSSSLSWIMAGCTSMDSDYWIDIVISQHVHYSSHSKNKDQTVAPKIL